MDDIRESTVNPAPHSPIHLTPESSSAHGGSEKGAFGRRRERVEKKIAHPRRLYDQRHRRYARTVFACGGHPAGFLSIRIRKVLGGRDVWLSGSDLICAGRHLYPHDLPEPRAVSSASQRQRGSRRGRLAEADGTFPKCGRSCPQPLPAQLYRTTLNIRFTAFTETAMRLIYTARRTSSTGSTHVSSLAAANTKHLYIHDLNYTASCYGLDRWTDQSVWYMYKYAMALEAIPSLAHQVASIIKSIFGRNKKVLALDMDNTLWGGVVGDDGPEGLELGEETPNGQAYLEFQRYIKRQKDIGVLLTVCSKNDRERAGRSAASRFRTFARRFSGHPRQLGAEGSQPLRKQRVY